MKSSSLCTLVLSAVCVIESKGSAYPFRRSLALEGLQQQRIFAKTPPSSASSLSARSITSLSTSLQGGGGADGSSSSSDMRGGGAVGIKQKPSKATLNDAKSTDISSDSVSSDKPEERKEERKEELKGGRWKRGRVSKDSSAAVYAKKLKNRNRMNFSRKVTHASFGLFFAALNHVIPRERFVPGMAILTSSSLLMELLRYRRGFGWMNDALHFFLRGSLRKHEMEGKFTGSFYYFLGVTISAATSPKTAATLGICQLALADPSASYFGRQTRHIYWSRIENGLGGFGRNKGMLGFLGGALFCLPFNYRVLSIAKFSSSIPRTTLLSASLLLGLAGAFADLAVPTPALTMPHRIGKFEVPHWIPPFHVDDNFVVPIFSSYACTKIFTAFGWSQDLELARHTIMHTHHNGTIYSM